MKTYIYTTGFVAFVSKALTRIKFIGRISTMSKRKMVIYIPLEYHKNILKQFKVKT
ncbi:MAG: hypothetical protein ACJ71E_11740 [Nitrososphaeraceae archaeon]